MIQTFGQAKKRLAQFASSLGLGDVGAAVNSALDELASTRNWQRLRRVRRFAIEAGTVALPQDCGQILRACMNGTPISLRGPDYDFLMSGPGDLDYLPEGYRYVTGLQDRGSFPVMYDPDSTTGLKLAAFGTDDIGSGTVRVLGTNAAGERVTATAVYKEWEDPLLGTDGETYATVAAAAAAQSAIVTIERVILPEGLTGYVSLYGLDDGDFAFLSSMHPNIRVPEFRRYRIPGYLADETYELLAEVRTKFLPLVDDRDVIPFESLLPVQYMLQSLFYMNSGEIKLADDYRQRAESALVLREAADQERAGVVVINSQYTDSLGEASTTDWYNI